MGILNLQTHNEALLLKHLHKFFNKDNLPWVELIWDKHYRNGKLPSSNKPKGSFRWRDVLKLFDKYKGMASVMIHDRQSSLLWKDLWNGQVREIQFPELYSFAKNKSISLRKAFDSVNFHDLFNLPVSVEAYNQMQEFQLELSELVLSEENDKWTYIWGNTQFSSSKAYKSLTGHSQVHPIYRWLWKTSCQGKHNFSG
jgi:hypothetical protein